MFVMVDYIKEMTVKSCRYGEYGSFKHLLSLFKFNLLCVLVFVVVAFVVVLFVSLFTCLFRLLISVLSVL